MFETLIASRLIVISPRDEHKIQGRKFLIDHPTRPFLAVGTREVMMEILRTVQYHDPMHQEGFYYHFLSLTVRRSLLNDPNHIFLQWLRPSIVDTKKTPEDWITMAEWLEINNEDKLFERVA